MGDGERWVTRRAALVAGGGLTAIVLAACSSSSQGSDGANVTGRGSGVEMSYRNGRLLTGSQDGKRVDVTALIPRGSGHASGTFAAQPVDAHWNIAHNGSPDQTVLPATVVGTLAGVAASLSGIFDLGSSFLFQSGTLKGTAGGSPVQARAMNAPGESTSSVSVEGDFAGTPFSLYGTISGDLTSGYVKGTVAGKAFNVAASSRSQVVDVTGSYVGPPDLLALIVGALIYFLG